MILNIFLVGRVGMFWIVMYSVIKVFNYVFSMGLLWELEDDLIMVYIDCFVVMFGEV